MEVKEKDSAFGAGILFSGRLELHNEGEGRIGRQVGRAVGSVAVGPAEWNRGYAAGPHEDRTAWHHAGIAAEAFADGDIRSVETAIGRGFHRINDRRRRRAEGDRAWLSKVWRGR